MFSMLTFLERARSSLHVDAPITVETTINPLNGAAYEQAAVLIAVIDKVSPSIILTRRPMHMKKHAGQIALPGGKIEKSDINIAAAAMREAEEEIGLDSKYIEVLGYSDSYEIGSGYNIYPVVAKINQGYKLTADPNEVDDIFEVPLDFLMDDANFKRHSKRWYGKLHYYNVLEYGEYYIWGATADMLKIFRDKLSE